MVLRNVGALLIPKGKKTMQSTNTHCGLNRTSAIDRWMVTDDSPVFVGSEHLGTLHQVGSDWTARIIMASAIYLNAVDLLDDDEADEVISSAFSGGGDAGQLALAPIYQHIYPLMEEFKLPSQIMSRAMLYLYSVNWTVAQPFPSYSLAEFEPPEPSERVITLMEYPDGEYGLTVGDITQSSDTIGVMSMEVSRFIVTGFADVDHMYFTDKEVLIEAASLAQKYLREKWGYDFSVVDET